MRRSKVGPPDEYHVLSLHGEVKFTKLVNRRNSSSARTGPRPAGGMVTASAPAPPRWSLVDAVLMIAIALTGGLLIMIAGEALFHAACGLIFAAVAAYTLVQAQLAVRRDRQYAWFACTAVVGLLFLYWALQVVFRLPNPKKEIGCGGVKYIDQDGNHIEDPWAAHDGPGSMRTEL